MTFESPKDPHSLRSCSFCSEDVFTQKENRFNNVIFPEGFWSEARKRLRATTLDFEKGVLALLGAEVPVRGDWCAAPDALGLLVPIQRYRICCHFVSPISLLHHNS